MSPVEALLRQHEFVRARLLKTLDDIEASPFAQEALHWKMPFGKGRAHIAWQMMHCAATIDRYLHMRLQEKEPAHAKLSEHYGAGTTADAALHVSPREIREALALTFEPYRNYLSKLDDSRLPEKPFEKSDRTHMDIMTMLAWHEAHHQGQCHLIWNSFQAQRAGS